MDFANEPYVRYYRRKTTTWHRLCWEGQAVLSEVLVLIDRAGVFELSGLPPGEAVSLHLQKWPLPIVEAGVADMLRLKIIEHRGDSLVWPRYLEAQETAQSDRVRQAESRARRRERAMEAPEPPAGPNGHDVTKRDAPVTHRDDESRDVTETSRGVTPRHALSLLPSVPSVQNQQCSAEPAEKSPRAASRRRAAETSPEVRETRALVWDAYATAYQARYGVPPVRNAKVNSQIGRFVSSVDSGEAPEIAAFFVGHNDSFYVKRGHPVGLLLADAEKLRTEWRTGRSVTGTDARRVERTSSNVFARMALAEKTRGEVAH